MSANLVAGLPYLLRPAVFLPVVISCFASMQASDSTANPGSGKVVLKLEFEGGTNECAWLEIGEAQGSLLTTGNAGNANALLLTLPKAALPEVGGEGRDYTVALHSQLAHSATVLTVTMSEPGAVWFEEIELRQRRTSCEKRAQ